LLTKTVAVVLFASLALGIAAASGAPRGEGAAAASGIPSTRGVYAACYNTANGAMRLVKTSSGCRAFERKVSWSRNGRRGFRGLPGLQGLPGIAGTQGLMGPVGPAGVMGPVGPAGLDGLQGLQGEMGPQGPEGLQGLQGETGLQGLQGETGLQGLQGEAGPQGLQGEMGPQGPQGETGPAGPAGADGAQGVPGPAGGIASATHATARTPVSDFDSNNAKVATASCGAFEVAIGGGYEILGGTLAESNFGDLFVVYSKPTATNDGWTVRVVEATPVNPTWAISAYVVCVTAAA
jgi:hypothetical protein